MSGEPGGSFRLTRNRNPALNKLLRTCNSGRVARVLTEAIIWLRFRLVKMSANMFQQVPSYILRLDTTKFRWQGIANYKSKVSFSYVFRKFV